MVRGGYEIKSRVGVTNTAFSCLVFYPGISRLNNENLIYFSNIQPNRSSLTLMKLNKNFIKYLIAAMFCGAFIFFVSILVRQKQSDDVKEAAAISEVREKSKVTGTPVIEKKTIVQEVLPESATDPASKKRKTLLKTSGNVVSESTKNEADDHEFNRSDLEGIDQPVRVDVGDYEATVDDELTLDIRVEAPALANFSVLMEFDPYYLEYLADSAKAVGDTFRTGIEFYAQNDRGRMILISSGFPGEKHTNPVAGEAVATFRMVMKKSGVTKINFPDEGLLFFNARGQRMKYTIKGGEIVIGE